MSHDARWRGGQGGVRAWLAQIRYRATVMGRLGLSGPERTCIVCNYVGRFRAAGQPPRYGSRCPRCLSLERQRLLILCDRQYGLFADRRVLHFAPEPSVQRYIESVGPRHYDLADIESRRGQLTLDLERLALDHDTYDVVIVSHVLEHVRDDHRAFTELARVLAPGGVAVLMVPIIDAWERTYENPAVLTPAERTEHFGQFNHIRWYGQDFRCRVESAGFKVEEFVAVEPDVGTFGLTRGERVFLCHVCE